MEKKKLWLRLGITVMLSEAELSEIQRGDAAGRAIIREKVNGKKFILDGDVVVLAQEARSESEWSVEEGIKFRF